MKRTLAFYGKGGIGKSTVASTLSLLFHRAGRKVLHVGCDPKHDSSYKLVARQDVRTVMDMLLAGPETELTKDDLVITGRTGVDCIETGGPNPGVGCAGRGITRMFEVVGRAGVLDDGYEVITYDVLGDVVCGGFAAPIRAGYAKEVFVVASGEIMSLFAANNICRAVENLSRSGARLAGLIPNLRGVPGEQETLALFAEAVGVRLLHAIPRDPLIQEAEMASQTVVEYDSESAAAAHYRTLFEEIEAVVPDPADPTPLDDGAFERFVAGAWSR